MSYPIPKSAGASSGVPQTRQITAEQSPQISGSVTSHAHVGQYSGTGSDADDMMRWGNCSIKALGCAEGPGSIGQPFGSIRAKNSSY